MSLVFFILKIKKIHFKIIQEINLFYVPIYPTKHIYLFSISIFYITNTILVNTSVAYAGNKSKLARLPECYSSCCIDYGKKMQQKTKGNTKNEGFLIILTTILLFTVKLLCYKRIPDQSDSPGN
jgi:hypothetical protein